MTVTPSEQQREELLAEVNETLFRLVWRYRQAADQAFAPLGLNTLRAYVLDLVDRDQVHPKALAEALDFAPPAVSHLLRDLEERGLLKRSHDTSDRRKVRLALTAKGSRTLDQLRDTWRRLGVEQVSKLSDEEATELLRLHTRLLGEQA